MNVQSVIDRYGNNRENLLQILHELQEASPDHSLHHEDLEEVSRLMGLSLADLIGTASFYTMFSLTPRGRHIIRLCESPPCYIMGSENILSAIRDRLGIGIGETTDDGCFTLETSSCLGACGVAPVMMVDDEVYGNLTEERVVQILDKIAHMDSKKAGANVAGKGA